MDPQNLRFVSGLLCVYEATGKMDLVGDLLIGQPIANVRIYILDNQNQAPACWYSWGTFVLRVLV